MAMDGMMKKTTPAVSSDKISREDVKSVIVLFKRVFKVNGPVQDQAVFDEWCSRLCGYDRQVFLSAVRAYVESGKAEFDLEEICNAADAYIIRREQFKDVVIMLKNAYPNLIPSKEIFEFWLSNLIDIDYDCLYKAVRNYIHSNHFPPAISDIRLTATQLMEDGESLPAVEWQKLRNALGSAYAANAEEIYNGLNDVTKECIGGFSGFRELSLMDLTTLERVTRPTFLKEYESRERARIVRKSVVPVFRTPETEMVKYIETADRHLLEQKKPDAEECADSGKTPMPPHLKEELYRRLGYIKGN